MSLREFRSLIGQTLDEFFHDGCTRFAAAISYYMLFSLPPLSVVVALLFYRFAEPETIEALIARVIRSWTSPEVATAVQRVLDTVEAPRGSNPAVYLLGAAAAVFGASGGFLQFQTALNRAWYVQPKDEGIRAFFWKRVASFPLLLLLFALLLGGFGVSAILLAFGREWLEPLWGPFGTWLPVLLDLVLFVLLVWGLVTVVFWLLPDAEVAWRDVILGAFVTACLIWLGKILTAAYVSRWAPAQAFGPAASFALLLLWIYFTSAFLLLGAEFTQVWSRRAGRPIHPSPGAELTPAGRARLARLEAMEDSSRDLTERSHA